MLPLYPPPQPADCYANCAAVNHLLLMLLLLPSKACEIECHVQWQLDCSIAKVASIQVEHFIQLRNRDKLFHRVSLQLVSTSC